MTKPMTKTEWMNWVEKAWNKSQQEAWREKKQWVGLTDEKINEAIKSCMTVNTYKYFRAIEAKLQEKNS